MVEDQSNPFSDAINKVIDERERLQAEERARKEKELLNAKLEAEKKAKAKAIAEQEAKAKLALELAEARKVLIEDVSQAIAQIPPRGLDEDGSIPFVSEALAWFYTDENTLKFFPLTNSTAISIIERDKRLLREGSKAHHQALQISLMWNNYNDLDLHVICPSGERIHGGNKKSECGGELDVDANVRAETRKPVENVFWEEGKAPTGTYQVYVHYYRKHQKRRSQDPTKFQVIIQTPSSSATFSGELSFGDPILLVHEFELHELSERTPPDKYRVLRTGGVFLELEKMVNPILAWLAEENFSLITEDGIEFSLAWKKR